MRSLSLCWLWWALVWDITRYCTLNPWRFFVLLPLWLTSCILVMIFSPRIWRERLYWNICQCWEAIEAGEIRRPGKWLAKKLDLRNYLSLR